MTVTRTSRVSERRECETRYSHRYTDIDASLAEDRRRRAARKAAKLESSRKAQYAIGRQRRDAKMALLLRLLITVGFVCTTSHHVRRVYKIRLT